MGISGVSKNGTLYLFSNVDLLIISSFLLLPGIRNIAEMMLISWMTHPFYFETVAIPMLQKSYNAQENRKHLLNKSTVYDRHNVGSFQDRIKQPDETAEKSTEHSMRP